jgi:1-acyl-sn-glycerol-3-phosphate acyltransferase
MSDLIRKTKWFLIKYVIWGFLVQPFLILCKLEFRNEEQIPTGPCIMAFNHVSYMDWLIVYPYLYIKKKKKIYFIGKKKLFKNPLFKHLMEYGDVICVDQENVDKTFLNQVRKVLKEGHILGIFPEGKRSNDGQLIKAQPGITYLALKNKVPVVPVGLNGFYDILPKGKKLPRVNKLIIDIGKPIDLKEYYGKRLDKCEVERITRLIMKQIGNLTHQEYNY